MPSIYGLLGYPLQHSFSARYFAAKFANNAIDATYMNWEYANVHEALSTLRVLPDLCGFNVTIPHKQAVIPLLDELSAEARAIGAVNVVGVTHQAQKRIFVGYNTDVVGFSDSLVPLLVKGCHRQALVLGTGGASLAISYALQRLGLKVVHVSRTNKRGCITYGALTAQHLQFATIIVNCTPLGMYPNVNTCPAIPYEFITSSHILYDLVYNPVETLFMKRGREHGAVVKNGLEMLHLQAEAAWDIWQR